MTSRRIQISKAINAVISSYAPTRVRFELEDWLIDLLKNLRINETPVLESHEINFRYNEIYIVFLQKRNLFNLTRIDKNDELREASINLSEFLKLNYGVTSLKDLSSQINFSDCDLELMAMQLTDVMIDWGEYPIMLSCLSTLKNQTKPSGNP